MITDFLNQFEDSKTVSDEIYLARMIYWRDCELADTDWTQLTDSPVDKAAWATYRQGLRDLTKQNVAPRFIAIPVKP